MEEELKRLPMFEPLNKSVREYIFSFVDVGIYAKDDEIPMHHPNEAFDFIYVAKGHMGVHLLDMDKALTKIANPSEERKAGLGALKQMYL
jgi:hypothetical protein